MTDDIIPHLNTEEVPRELTAEDFQRQLYSWFEERGLLSELRAHLRTQMIQVLKDTAIGRSLSAQIKPSASPKLQALNILVADFLQTQDCYYSLSVFITEAPLLNVLPDLIDNSVGGSILAIRNPKKWKFKEKDMWDIMETLGIFRNTDKGQQIANIYLDASNQEALLTCIVRNWYEKPIVINKEQKWKEAKNWIESIKGLLGNYNIDEQNILMIIATIKREIHMEKNKIKSELGEENAKLEKKLLNEVAAKEEKYRNQISTLENHLKEANYKLKQFQQEKKNTVEEDIKKSNEELISKEQFLNQREMELKKLEANLELYEMQKRVEKHKLERTEDQLFKQLQDEYNNIKDQITQTQEAVTDVTKSISMKELQNAEVLNELLMKLQQENAALQGINSKQHARIEILSNKAKFFMNELEKKENHYAKPTAPLPIHREQEVPAEITHRTGGGEEVEAIRPTYRNVQSQRIRPPVLLIPNDSTSSSDENVDLLQETRQRLKQLEEESRQVDSNYKKFRRRQLQGMQMHPGQTALSLNTDKKNIQLEPFADEIPKENLKETSKKTSSQELIKNDFNEENNQSDESVDSNDILKALYEAGTSGLSFSSIDGTDTN